MGESGILSPAYPGRLRLTRRGPCTTTTAATRFRLGRRCIFARRRPARRKKEAHAVKSTRKKSLSRWYPVFCAHPTYCVVSDITPSDNLEGYVHLFSLRDTRLDQTDKTDMLHSSTIESDDPLLFCARSLIYPMDINFPTGDDVWDGVLRRACAQRRIPLSKRSSDKAESASQKQSGLRKGVRFANTLY